MENQTFIYAVLLLKRIYYQNTSPTVKFELGSDTAALSVLFQSASPRHLFELCRMEHLLQWSDYGPIITVAFLMQENMDTRRQKENNTFDCYNTRYVLMKCIKLPQWGGYVRAKYISVFNSNNFQEFFCSFHILFIRQ